MKKLIVALVVLGLIWISGVTGVNGVKGEESSDSIPTPSVEIVYPEEDVRIEGNKIFYLTIKKKSATNKLKNLIFKNDSIFEGDFLFEATLSTDLFVFSIEDEEKINYLRSMEKEELLNWVRKVYAEGEPDIRSSSFLILRMYYRYSEYYTNTTWFEFADVEKITGEIAYIHDPQCISTELGLDEYAGGRRYYSPSPSYFAGVGDYHNHGYFPYPNTGVEYTVYDTENYWYEISAAGTFYLSKMKVYFKRIPTGSTWVFDDIEIMLGSFPG